jgi:hypothetical protein
MRFVIFALGVAVSALPVFKSLNSTNILETCQLNPVQNSELHSSIERQATLPPLTGPPGAKPNKIASTKPQSRIPNAVSGYANNGLKMAGRRPMLSQKRKPKVRLDGAIQDTADDIAVKQLITNWWPYYELTDNPESDTTDLERQAGCVENPQNEPHDIDGDLSDVFGPEGGLWRGEGGVMSCQDTTEGEVFAEEFDSDGAPKPKTWQVGMDDPNSSASDLENPNDPSSGSDSDFYGLTYWHGKVVLEKPYRPVAKRQTLSELSSGLWHIRF